MKLVKHIKNIKWSLLIGLGIGGVLTLTQWVWPPIPPVTWPVVVLDLQFTFILTSMLALFEIFGPASFEIQAKLRKSGATLSHVNTRLGAAIANSCSWQNEGDFFSHLCEKICEIGEGESKPLSIYRGYDHCPEEPHIALREAIIDAMAKGRINLFRRVFVVTSKDSIDCAVEWLQLFATHEKSTPETMERCNFAVAFRYSYNLGSFVALGHRQCFIAIPKLSYANESHAVAETACGMFALRYEIAEVIHDYTRELINTAWKGKTKHSMPFALKTFVTGTGFDSQKLIGEIRRNFNDYEESNRAGHKEQM